MLWTWLNIHKLAFKLYPGFCVHFFYLTCIQRSPNNRACIKLIIVNVSSDGSPYPSIYLFLSANKGRNYRQLQTQIQEIKTSRFSKTTSLRTKQWPILASHVYCSALNSMFTRSKPCLSLGAMDNSRAFQKKGWKRSQTNCSWTGENFTATCQRLIKI